MTDIEAKDILHNDALIFRELSHKYTTIALGIVEDITIIEDMVKRHYEMLPDLSDHQTMKIKNADRMVVQIIKALKVIQTMLLSDEHIKEYNDGRS